MTNSHIQEKLSKGSLIVYGGLALPIAIAELPIILYLPAFYAKEVGLSIGMVGLVFLLARLWDGISDPIIGILSDRTNSHFGRRKPWIIVGAPLLMTATWFLCNPPVQVGLLYLFLWAILFYTSQTIVKIPYWSWGAELSNNYEERSRITGFRESGSMLGNLIAAAAPVLLLPNGAPVRDVLLLISVLLVVLIPLAVTPLTIAMKDHNPIARYKFDLIQTMRELSSNGPLKRFLVAIACLDMSLGVINSVAIFLVDIGFDLPGTFFSLFLIEYIIAILVAPLVVRLASRLGKHIVLTMLFCLLLLVNIIGFMLPAGNYALVVVWVCMMGVVFSGVFILPPSILADIVDHDTAGSGEERAGIYMAALNLTFKLGLALGVGIAYGFLDIAGFDAAAATHTARDVTLIRIAFFGISSVLLIPAIPILWKFPITKTVQRELRRKIEENISNVAESSDKENGNKSISAHQKNKEIRNNNSVTTLLPDNG